MQKRATVDTTQVAFTARLLLETILIKYTHVYTPSQSPRMGPVVGVPTLALAVEAGRWYAQPICLL
jgi:hypothetical protein